MQIVCSPKVTNRNWGACVYFVAFQILGAAFGTSLFTGVLITNAPAIFSLVWRFVRNFLSAELQAQVQILSPMETPAVLKQLAPAGEIPTAIEGGAGCCSVMPLGVARQLGFTRFDSLLIKQPKCDGGCAEAYTIPRE